MLLKVAPPFDFHLSASVFSQWDKQIRHYENGKYWQVVDSGDKLILVEVEASGSVDEPSLSIALRSNGEVSSSELKKVEEAIAKIFNLGLDLKQFYQDIRGDEVILGLVPHLRGLKITNTLTIFEALIHSIIQQQISLNVSRVLEENLIKAFGSVLKLDEGLYYAFPTPQQLAQAEVSELRRCGLSLKKAEYISEIARLVSSGRLDLDKFEEYEDVEEVITELDRIKGVGVWTAELTLLRGMQRFEVIPADDLGVRRVISSYYAHGAKVSGEEVRRIAQRWGRWKGLAIFYLIMAQRLGLKV